MFAYLTADGIVRSIGSTDKSLAEAQSVMDADYDFYSLTPLVLTTKISNSPDGLKLKVAEHHIRPVNNVSTYHTKTSGDGTSLNDYTATVDLRCKKDYRYVAIDARTQSIISSGFCYKGERFSASSNAQRNWIALQIAASAGMLTYPVTITTFTDAEYSLQDAVDIANFYGTGIVTIKLPYDSGRQLKIQILAATTEAGVDAIVDDRPIHPFEPSPSPSPSPSE